MLLSYGTTGERPPKLEKRISLISYFGVASKEFWVGDEIYTFTYVRLKRSVILAKPVAPPCLL